MTVSMSCPRAVEPADKDADRVGCGVCCWLRGNRQTVIESRGSRSIMCD